MKELMLRIWIWFIPGILAKVTFLQMPELHKLQQFKEDKGLKSGDNDLLSDEDIDDDDLHPYVDDMLTNDQLQEFGDAISVLDTYDVYNDGIYDPFSNATRRKKRSVSNELSNYLKGMVEHLKKMTDTTQKATQQSHYDKAVDLLDNYLSTVKSTQDRAKENALQIFKQDNVNLVLVNCGGWLWYPVRNIKKIITCKDGNMRFEQRFQHTVQICDDYTCRKVKM